VQKLTDDEFNALLAAIGLGGGAVAAAAPATRAPLAVPAVAVADVGRASAERMYTSRDIAKVARIGDFKSATAAQVNLRPPSNSAAGQASTVEPTEDNEAVLRGFTHDPREDDVCAAVWAAVRHFVRPQDGDDEVAVVRKFMERVFCAVKAAASASGMKCAKAFYEYDVAATDGRVELALHNAERTAALCPQ